MQYETITDTSKNPRRQGSLDPTVPVKRSQGSLDPTVPVSDNNKTVIIESGEKEKTAAEAKQDIKNAVPPAAGTERTIKDLRPDPACRRLLPAAGPGGIKIPGAGAMLPGQ